MTKVKSISLIIWLKVKIIAFSFIVSAVDLPRKCSHTLLLYVQYSPDVIHIFLVLYTQTYTCSSVEKLLIWHMSYDKGSLNL